jgi:hypothetical protein
VADTAEVGVTVGLEPPSEVRGSPVELSVLGLVTVSGAKMLATRLEGSNLAVAH